MENPIDVIAPMQTGHISQINQNMCKSSHTYTYRHMHVYV